MNRLFSISSPSQVIASNSAGKMVFKNVTHVIFDMDGLLLDTETLYTKATQLILDPYNKTYTWDVKSQLMGYHSMEVAKKIVEIYELPMTAEEYAALMHKSLRDIMPNAELLPDTEHIYEKVVSDIAKSYNKIYTKDVRMKILGTTEQNTAKIAVTDLKLPITVPEFSLRFSELLRERLGNAPLLRGAERLIKHLHTNKIPFCLATSSSKEMAEIKSQKHSEIFSLFNHKVMGSTDPEVKFGKPSPDIFLVAAQRFPDKPNPEKCLVFEDAPNGVKAACSAGMQVVMVPDQNVPQEMCKDASLVLASLEDFRPQEFGLPAFIN